VSTVSEPTTAERRAAVGDEAPACEDRARAASVTARLRALVDAPEVIVP
jgi:hypothetical protein